MGGGVYAHECDEVAHGESDAVKRVVYSATCAAPRGVEIYEHKALRGDEVIEVG